MIKTGTRINVRFEEKHFEVFVIDSNGIDEGLPTVGLAFRMIERSAGLPQSTLSKWLVDGLGETMDNNNPFQWLQSPSGKGYRLRRILGQDNNTYKVLEISDLINLVADVIKKPGKLRKSTKNKLLNFLSWFAAKGICASTYAHLKVPY